MTVHAAIPIAKISTSSIQRSIEANHGRLMFPMIVPPFNYINRCSIVSINPCRPRRTTPARHKPIGTRVDWTGGDADAESSVSIQTYRAHCRDIARLLPSLDVHQRGRKTCATREGVPGPSLLKRQPLFRVVPWEFSPLKGPATRVLDSRASGDLAPIDRSLTSLETSPITSPPINPKTGDEGQVI